LAQSQQAVCGKFLEFNSKIMRILQVIPSYLPATRYGGPIFSTHALSKTLAKRGHEVQVYTTYGGQDPNSLPPPEVELDGVAVNYFRSDLSPRLSWAPGLARRLKRELHRFDIVHLQTVFLWPTWCAARHAQALKLPYVISPRGMLVKDLIKRRNRVVKSAWLELFEKTNLRRAAAIHVTSATEAQDLKALRLSLPETAIIPNGIEQQEAVGPISPDILAATKCQPYILFFGRLSWKKGIDTLLEAFARTTRGHLIIAGTDDEGLSRILNKTAEDLGVSERVRIIARTISGADKHHLFRSARLFALTSLSENFGNTVLEALAAGIAVVVTPGVGAAEIVLDAKAGFVVPKNAAMLSETFDMLLNNESHARELGERGRAYVAQNCSWDTVAEKMESLYERCISRASERIGSLPSGGAVQA
jgi:glycosyltransferase involved in cell wall biosynthesis